MCVDIHAYVYKCGCKSGGYLGVHVGILSSKGNREKNKRKNQERQNIVEKIQTWYSCPQTVFGSTCNYLPKLEEHSWMFEYLNELDLKVLIWVWLLICYIYNYNVSVIYRFQFTIHEVVPIFHEK